MKATELLDQMKEREEALSFFLKKDYIEKLTDKEAFALQNCEVTLEYYGVHGEIYDITKEAYIVVKPDEERNCIVILTTIDNGDTRTLYFTLSGVQAEKMLNEDEVFSSAYEYVDRETITYRLTIKKAV